ncbi:MAG: acetone carboxylase [Rhodoluna sp.]|nr:acetone carboxylase [Rhodoluna sp.]MBP6186316.1 acetone carboxylase [Rhodoluna sp.]
MTLQKCSRAGCQAAAERLIIWRNPKIHTDGRTKTWSACADHQAFLVDYLQVREFFLESRPIEIEQ